MKILIPKGKTSFELAENTISIDKLDDSKIIVVDGSPNSIGLLTRIPDSGGWFVTDLLMARNLWSTITQDPRDVLEIFSGQEWTIIQFDNKKEFSDWIVAKIESMQFRPSYWTQV